MSPVPDLPDPDAIVAAVSGCPAVSGLSGGLAGEIATYLPGRRVSGVRTNPDSVEVHVIARYGAELHDVESQVRGAVTAAVGEAVRIDVVLADVEDPFAPDEDEESEPPALEAGPSAALPDEPSAPAAPPAAPAVPPAAPAVPPEVPGAVPPAAPGAVPPTAPGVVPPEVPGAVPPAAPGAVPPAGPVLPTPPPP